MQTHTSSELDVCLPMQHSERKKKKSDDDDDDADYDDDGGQYRNIPEALVLTGQ